MLVIESRPTDFIVFRMPDGSEIRIKIEKKCRVLITAPKEIKVDRESQAESVSWYTSVGKDNS